MPTKVCFKCGREFPLTECFYYKRTDAKDGFRNECKECMGRKFTTPYAKMIPIIFEGFKKCHHCGKTLPVKSFYKDKDAPDGYQRRCIECKQQYAKETAEHRQEYNKKYREEHKEEIAKKAQEYRDNHKEEKKQYRLEHKEEIAKYNKKYRIEHKEYFVQWKKAHSAEYWQRYKDRHREQKSNWWKNNKEKSKIYSQKRRAKAKKLESTLTCEQWETIKNCFNNKCAYCGKELPLAQEHFIPVTKAGNYTLNNIIPACKSCNSSKSNKDFFEWYPKHRHYSKKREKAILSFLGYANQDTQQPMLLI